MLVSREDICLEIFRRYDLPSWSPVASAVDQARGIEEAEREAESAIEPYDPVGCLIREDDRTGMIGEPPSEPHLIAPAEAFLGVMCELHVIGRIGVHKVAGFEVQLLEVGGVELPSAKTVRHMERNLERS